MSGLLQELLAFPPQSKLPLSPEDADYHKGAQAVVKTLRDTSASKLIGPISGSDTILNIVNPATHSLPYLYALLAHIESKNVVRPGDQLWQKALDFVSVFDPIQVRYSGTEFRKLLEAIERGATHNPVLAIEPISTAILRLDPSGATLTSTHLVLVRLCLQTKAYPMAQPVLDHDIYHLPTQTSSKSTEKQAINIPSPNERHIASSTFITTGSGFSHRLNYQDHLLYHVYGAIIYIGLWEWERALTFLEIVITAPVYGANVSMIQVEAYKKWVLVSLLVHGKPQGLPGNVHTLVAKHCKSLAKAYDVLGDAFKESTPERLRAEIQAGPYVQDSNYTLALLVLSAHQRFKVQNLSETYASLPLTQVVDLAFPKGTALHEVEGYIQNLISNSQLPGASLTKSTASKTYLRFAPKGSTTIPESQLYNDLVRQRGKVEELGTHVVETQRKIEVKKEYVEVIRKARKAEGKPAKAGQDVGETMPGSYDDDMIADM